MAFRRELLLEIMLTLFQDFDRGRIVMQEVPASWNLKPGDHLEYEAGQNISGVAEVIGIADVPKEKSLALCVLKKIS